MTISTTDIVTILRKRIDQCRCLGSVPATRCCGGCEHDIRCLTEIVEVRRERDEARREVLNAMHPDLRNFYADAREWDCLKEQQPPLKSDPNIISLDELARCTRNQTP